LNPYPDAALAVACDMPVVFYNAISCLQLMPDIGDPLPVLARDGFVFRQASPQ
jgi:hypothetical protein